MTLFSAAALQQKNAFSHVLAFAAAVSLGGLVEREGVGEDPAQGHFAIDGEAGTLGHQLAVEGPAAEQCQLAMDDIWGHSEGSGAVRADVARLAPRPRGPRTLDARLRMPRAVQRRVGALAVG